jgi:hypothetical protein
MPGAPYESQRVSVRNMVVSPNKQLTYGEVMADINLTHRVRFDPGIFANFTDGVRSDLSRVGKGHPFASERQTISRDVALAFNNQELTDFLAGWFFAFLCGKDVITGAGPFTHTMTFDQSTGQAVATNIYIEDNAAIKRKLSDMSMVDLTISIPEKGPVMVSANFVGTGAFTNVAMGSLPALPTNTYLLGSDADIQLGPPGAPVSFKGRALGAQIKFVTGTQVHRAPGGLLVGSFNRVGLQRVSSVQVTIAASNTDDVQTLWENKTVQETKIIINSGASAQLTLDFPQMYFNDAPPSVDADRIIYQLNSDQDNILQGANPIFTAIAINSQATAYLVGA